MRMDVTACCITLQSHLKEVPRQALGAAMFLPKACWNQKKNLLAGAALTALVGVSVGVGVVAGVGTWEAFLHQSGARRWTAVELNCPSGPQMIRESGPLAQVQQRIPTGVPMNLNGEACETSGYWEHPLLGIFPPAKLKDHSYLDQCFSLPTARWITAQVDQWLGVNA